MRDQRAAEGDIPRHRTFSEYNIFLFSLPMENGRLRHRLCTSFEGRFKFVFWRGVKYLGQPNSTQQMFRMKRSWATSRESLNRNSYLFLFSCLAIIEQAAELEYFLRIGAH